jgi:hypothetical protein
MTPSCQQASVCVCVCVRVIVQYMKVTSSSSKYVLISWIYSRLEVTPCYTVRFSMYFYDRVRDQTHNSSQQVSLINSMEQSLSREANSRSASEEILHPSWNSKVYHRGKKMPPLIPILS